MVELGSRRTTERVRVGNSPPTAARAVFLPDIEDLRIRNCASRTIEIYVRWVALFCEVL